MRKILLSLLAISLGMIFCLKKGLDRMEKERDSYKQNTFALLEGEKRYQIQDSLNVLGVKALELKLKDYKRLRENDFETIEKLQIKNRNLTNVITSNSKTITNLETKIKQSLVYIDSLGNEVEKNSGLVYQVDTLQCLNVNDKWYSLNGCIRNEVFRGTLVNHDSLVIGATIEYKRFLGFLWKTNTIKSQKVDIVSKNPNTRIESAQFVIIKF